MGVSLNIRADSLVVGRIWSNRVYIMPHMSQYMQLESLPTGSESSTKIRDVSHVKCQALNKKRKKITRKIIITLSLRIEINTLIECCTVTTTINITTYLNVLLVICLFLTLATYLVMLLTTSLTTSLVIQTGA